MLNELNSLWLHFHFIRPWWLLGLVLLAAAMFWFKKSHSSSSHWNHVVDAPLQSHVLITPDQQKKQSSYWWMPLALSLMLLSLAGPTWQKIPQATFKTQSALVIVLDLSRSMDAADITPSRLLRAKLKIIDLLNKRKQGQTALIAYAAEAFTVSPLTEDKETIIALLKTLNTQMMPSQGSRLDKALQKASELIHQANMKHGNIVVFTDGISAKEQGLIKTEDTRKRKVSVIAVGTERGAPIAVKDQGYLKDSKGQIVVAKMQPKPLQKLAQQSAGVFATLRNNDDDIDALIQWMKPDDSAQHSQKTDQKFDSWYEQGYWLLCLVMPLVLLGFRRGFLLFMVCLVLPSLQPVHAFEYQNWFKNSDQKALEHYQKGDFEQAQKNFTRKDWKAAAEYKNKDYEASVNAFDALQGDDALYNKGNALAKLQRYKEAIQAWDEVLKHDPSNEDALYNKKQVEDFLKKQQQQQKQNNKQSKDQKNKDKKQQQQQQNKQSKDQKKKDQKNKDQQQQQNSQSQQNQQQKDKQSGQEKKQSAQQKQAAQQKKQAKEKAKQDKEQKDKQQKAKAEQDKADKVKKNQPQTAQQKEQQEKRKQAEQQAFNEAQQLKQKPLDEQTKQWLRRIPDDPGGLLRNKFRYQYQQLQRHSDEQKPW